MEEDLTRRGFLQGLGLAAAGAAGLGASDAMAGSSDPGYVRKVEDKHYEMMEKNPRYAKEHAGLNIAIARGITGAAAENNKRWTEKTAQLLQKYGVNLNEGILDTIKQLPKKANAWLNKPIKGMQGQHADHVAQGAMAGMSHGHAVGHAMADLGVAEGAMKQQMHRDAESMSLADFLDKYPDDAAFWHAVNDVNEAKCNMTEAGEYCPKHGLEECGIMEYTGNWTNFGLEESDALSQLKRLAHGK